MSEQGMICFIERVEIFPVFGLDGGDKLFPAVWLFLLHVSRCLPLSWPEPWISAEFDSVQLTPRPCAPKEVDLLTAKQKDASKDQSLDFGRMGLCVREG